jgi:GNAT superfamily N-acetyltransferase
MGAAVRIRPAVEADVPLILRFICELAEYERLRHEVVATEERLRDTLFGPRPAAEVVIAEDANEPVGFALFFHNYSTFLAQPGIYLEDLYVRPEARGRGVGRTLLPTWPVWRRSAAAAGWSGGCWTGTSPPSASTAPWARSR